MEHTILEIRVTETGTGYRKTVRCTCGKKYSERIIWADAHAPGAFRRFDAHVAKETAK